MMATKKESVSLIRVRAEKAFRDLATCVSKLMRETVDRGEIDELRSLVKVRDREISALQVALQDTKKARDSIAEERDVLGERVDELTKAQGRLRREREAVDVLASRARKMQLRTTKRRKMFQARGDELKRLRHAVSLVRARLWDQLQGMRSGSEGVDELWAFMDLTNEKERAR